MHEIGLDIRARGVESALRAPEDGTGSEANKYAGVSGLESSVPWDGNESNRALQRR